MLNVINQLDIFDDQNCQRNPVLFVLGQRVISFFVGWCPLICEYSRSHNSSIWYPWMISLCRTLQLYPNKPRNHLKWKYFIQIFIFRVPKKLFTIADISWPAFLGAKKYPLPWLLNLGLYACPLSWLLTLGQYVCPLSWLLNLGQYVCTYISLKTRYFWGMNQRASELEVLF